MPPSFLRGFGNSPQSKPFRSSIYHSEADKFYSQATFGSEMGVINGTDWGRLLMRGSFNAQPWGDLYPVQVDGVKNGTDLYFNKSQSLLGQV
jgi:hypothetical protein